MAKKCDKSWLFDADELGVNGTSQTGGIQPLLSLCDRLKPGFYVLARTGEYGAAVSKANGMGLQGICFLFGDTDDPPEDTPLDKNTPIQYRAQRLVFRPNDGDDAKDYQKFQKAALADVVTSPIPGLGACRGNKMMAGGLFKLGYGGYASPAAAAQTIAQIRNDLFLDFVCIDIDHEAWKGPNANKKALVLAQHVQERFAQDIQPSNGVVLSSHCPLFFVLPKSTDGYDNLVTRSGPSLPDDRCFEPFVNGYSGPKTFAMPRVPAGSSFGALATAYQWAKPYAEGAGGSDPFGIGRCEFLIDVRDGGNADSTASLINKPGAGLSVQFHNQTHNWTPWCGLIMFDDLEHFSGTGVDKPIKYWDYDGQTEIEGALVPIWLPDPPPLAIVDKEYRADDGSPVTLEFENWKTGHTSDLRIPDQVTINLVRCADTVEPEGSWLRFNGAPIFSIGSNQPFIHGTSGNNFRFTGKPLVGDDGVYALLMDFRGSQSNQFGGTDTWTQVSFVIEVLDPNLIGPEPGNRKSSTGIPIMKPDIPERTVYNSGLHPLMPRQVSVARIPNDWGISTANSDWCKGTKPANPPKPIPRPPREQHQNTSDACGFTYFPDVIEAAWDECAAYDLSLPSQICSTWSLMTEYAGFVFGLAGAISHWDPNFDDGHGHIGLWGLSPTQGIGAGSTVEQLKDPLYATNLAVTFLHAAWLDSIDFVGWTCGPPHLGQPGHPYKDRINHGALYFADQTGSYPGAHCGNFSILAGSDCHSPHPCFQTSQGPAVPWSTEASGPADCFRSYVASGNLPAPTGGPGSGGGGGGGQPSTVLGCPARGSITADCQWHLAMEGLLAVDIGNITGSSLYATCDGSVTFKDWDPRYGPNPAATKYLPDCDCYKPPGYGVMINISCDDGVHSTRYGHMLPSTIGAAPKVGDHVKNGDVIGQMDTTGFASGPHTHFELFENGTRICPINSFPAGCP